MKIITAITKQRARDLDISPSAQRLPSDRFIAVVDCEESRQLYRAWRKAQENHNTNITRCKDDVLAGKRPRFDMRKMLLDEAKIDCLERLLLVSLLADYPECLLELDMSMILCEGWELVLRSNDSENEQPCNNPLCPVHGTEAIIGIQRR